MTYRDSFVRPLAAKLYPNFHVHFDPSLRAHRQPPGKKKKKQRGPGGRTERLYSTGHAVIVRTTT